jgi:hypothetical protein
LLLLASTGICSAANPNFSGTWKQNNERCVPQRTGDVTLQIDHRDPNLMVETTAVRRAAPARHAVQRYTTDGRTSISTGADGDEFHTSITWSGPSLVFAVEEHEDGRILLSQETWTLLENGAVVQRVRQRSDGGVKQTLIYTR